MCGKAGEATQAGYFDERFRIVRPRRSCAGACMVSVRMRGKIHVLSARFEKSAQNKRDKSRHLAPPVRRRIRCSNKPLGDADFGWTLSWTGCSSLLNLSMRVRTCAALGGRLKLLAREKLRHEVPNKLGLSLTLDAQTHRLLRILRPRTVSAATRKRRRMPASRHTNIVMLCVRWLRPADLGCFRWPHQRTPYKTTIRDAFWHPGSGDQILALRG